jgi:hypothetical protein
VNNDPSISSIPYVDLIPVDVNFLEQDASRHCTFGVGHEIQHERIHKHLLFYY